ncbi:MAG: DUF1365 domain-containing protein [Wenzhouxiangellaceae bacterium]|nr:DUF1365 domain-containing protein [Wenzhouxiangellaceae bacterium]
MPPDQYGTGWIWHRREHPRPHAFRYRAWFSLLDVEQLEPCFARSRLWSLERPNLVQLRRCDCIGPQELSIAEAVRARVQDELGFRPEGRLRMLTHLRQWGHVFNPVTFYLAEGADGTLAAIVAEIHNTPWGERHAYVLDARQRPGPVWRFDFDKVFHVSPFLPMGLRYQWRFSLEPEQFSVHMKVSQHDRQLFVAGMRLALHALDRRAMRWLPFRYPLMPQRVVVGIYWQALKLWLKRTPVHDHPGTLKTPGI